MDPVPPVIRRYLEAYNGFDVDTLVACLTEDVVFENVSGGQTSVRTQGRPAFMELARQGIAAFSAREQRVTNCIAAGSRAALRVSYRATVAADLPNGWTAGQVIALDGASFFTLRDDLIAEVVDVS